ncbi:Uncharacterized protein PBTT_07688 [Plasmodiophora brassicae]|nr:hypothetical protein PBRA_004872 [Plasmodiophora brassicae]
MLCFGWVNTIAGVLGTILLIVFDAKSPGGQSPASAVVQLLPYLEMIVFGAACLTAVYKKSSRAGFITIILSGLQIVLNLVVSLVVSTMLPVALVQLAVNVYYWYVMWSYYQKLLDRDWAIAHNIPLDQVSPV